MKLFKIKLHLIDKEEEVTDYFRTLYCFAEQTGTILVYNNSVEQVHLDCFNFLKKRFEAFQNKINKDDKQLTKHFELKKESIKISILEVVDWNKEYNKFFDESMRLQLTIYNDVALI